MNVPLARPRRRPLAGLAATGLLGLALATGLAACGSSTTASSPLSAASVNGHPVSLSDFQQVAAYYKASAGAQAQSGPMDWQSPAGRDAASGAQGQALNFLIDLELMRQLLNAHKADKAYSDSAYQAELKADQKTIDGSIASALKSSDPTQKATVQAELPYLTGRVRYLFAEQEATESMLLKVVSLKTVHLRAVIVTDQKQAGDLVQQLRGGTDFTQLATKVDPNPQQKDYDYGDVWQGELPTQFDAAVFATNHPKYDYVAFSNQYIVTEATNDRMQPLTTLNNATQERQLFEQWLGGPYRQQGKVETSVYIPATPTPAAAQG